LGLGGLNPFSLQPGLSSAYDSLAQCGLLNGLNPSRSDSASRNTSTPKPQTRTVPSATPPAPSVNHRHKVKDTGDKFHSPQIQASQEPPQKTSKPPSTESCKEKPAKTEEEAPAACPSKSIPKEPEKKVEPEVRKEEEQQLLPPPPPPEEKSTKKVEAEPVATPASPPAPPPPPPPPPPPRTRTPAAASEAEEAIPLVKKDSVTDKPESPLVKPKESSPSSSSVDTEKVEESVVVETSNKRGASKVVKEPCARRTRSSKRPRLENKLTKLEETVSKLKENVFERKFLRSHGSVPDITKTSSDSEKSNTKDKGETGDVVSASVTPDKEKSENSEA